jgi:hypothetical protein
LEEDNGILWGGVALLLEHDDAHHVSDNLGGKFEWVDMNHMFFAFLVKTLSDIFVDAFSNFRVEFLAIDLPPAFQGVAVASHAVFEARRRQSRQCDQIDGRQGS